MENLEDVLQALDEFQKMRPSEIPRELEDYLCWVAKTGDPVYQWSLIKTLFREKLTRVMTDFYESCPSLELAPCPNVEHFNYDTMKTSLLERLESFANAPFTVQRICELLTAPRKEYNRVDKFMRAIEKNILVVSTREPGPIARRSTNGDGMVNGSVEEESSVTQPPQDVEMEYWEKDCASTVTISVHTVENESPMLHTVIPTTTVVKNVFGPEDVSHEKLESTSSKIDVTASSFMPSTPEFTGVSNVPSQIQTQESTLSQTMENLPAVASEATGVISDVSEAIINEDTSSQPGLDLENEDSDSIESIKKLQTTFQAKDFTTVDDKSSKLYQEATKPSEKASSEETTATSEETFIATENINESIVKPNSKSETIAENSDSANPVVENLLQMSEINPEDRIKVDAIPEGTQTASDSLEIIPEKTEEQAAESTDKNFVASESGETKISAVEPDAGESSTPTTQLTVASLDTGDLKNESTKSESTNNTKPFMEDLASGDRDSNVIEENSEGKENLITEGLESEPKKVKLEEPNPVPITEEPKELVSASEKISNSPTSTDLPESATSIHQAINTNSHEDDEKLLTTVNEDVTELQGNGISATVKTKHEESVMPESNGCKAGKDQDELMEVDEEETLSMFQQDEPMEQEAVELSKS